MADENNTETEAKAPVEAAATEQAPSQPRTLTDFADLAAVATGIHVGLMKHGIHSWLDAVVPLHARRKACS